MQAVCPSVVILILVNRTYFWICLYGPLGDSAETEECVTDREVTICVISWSINRHGSEELVRRFCIVLHQGESSRSHQSSHFHQACTCCLQSFSQLGHAKSCLCRPLKSEIDSREGLGRAKLNSYRHILCKYRPHVFA